MPLPAAVSDPSWRDWLITMPALPKRGLGPAMAFSKRLASHLDSTPDMQLLSKAEARDVAFDLLIYADDLQAQVRVKTDVGLGSFIASGITAAGAIFIPGGQIPLGLVSLGLLGVGCASKYDVRREQDLLEALKDRLKLLIKRLRQ